MRNLLFIVFFLLTSVPVCALNAAQKIYETEREFEKMVAQRGMNAGFIEYLATDGIMFFPDAANARKVWTSRPDSPAALTWNPILIDVSSNGVLAYSIGNSVYRPKGKDDANAFSGHYLSIWLRQPNGDYRVVLDTGINHEKPGKIVTDWRSPAVSGVEKNEKGSSAAHSSIAFYQMAESGDVSGAFKTYLADDGIVMRDGNLPFAGKKAASAFMGKVKGSFKFAKRRSFVEGADLAYVYAPYAVVDKTGTQTENGNFVQVWKLRNGKWQIVVDVLIPIPAASK